MNNAARERIKMENRVFSTYNVARLCKVHYTTVINWVKLGKLKAYLTPGRHRRIVEKDLVSFLSKYSMPLPQESVKKKKSVLVVDDDPAALNEYRSALKGNGFGLYFASSGFAAGRMAYKIRPDLIILDFKMPGMDGFEVCAALRKDKETSKISIFAVTALNTEADVLKIKRCGVKQYIPKPVNIDNLLRLIKRALETRKRS